MSEFGQVRLQEIASNDPEFHTTRAGFMIDTDFGYVRCFEGFQIGRANPKLGKPDVIEDEVLDLAFVHVQKRVWGYGLGTFLMGQAIAEGQRRGFKIARFEPANPKSVSIAERLAANELVQNPHYVITEAEFLDPYPERRTTENALNDPNALNAEQAITYLKSLEADHLGMIVAQKCLARVEGIVRL